VIAGKASSYGMTVLLLERIKSHPDETEARIAQADAKWTDVHMAQLEVYLAQDDAYRAYLVGSGTGAVARRNLLGCVRGFPLRARLGVSVAPSPAPAASHAACGFPALRAPAHFASRVMRPISSQ
jgi:hypothetical protein